MIMLFIPWWTYVLLGTVAFACAFLGVWLAHLSGLGPKEGDDEPFPCFAHMQVDEYGNERWCWLQQGHDSDHVSQFGLDDDTAFTREWSEEDLACTCGADHSSPDFSFDQMRVHRIEWPVPSWLNEESLPALPQRRSKLPVQGVPEQPSLCTWGEDGGDNESACWKPDGHTGPHRVQDIGSDLSEGTEHNDPWPQCRQQSSDGRCVLASGHMMAHDYA